MKYQVVIRPISDAGQSSSAIKDVSGNTFREFVLGVVEGATDAHYGALPQSVRTDVALKALNMTIAPSAAQSESLIGYMSGIEGELDTSDVEAAVDDLTQ